jgi:5-methylthioadenosine/S-adenosylhomocysteine deaminase
MSQPTAVNAVVHARYVLPMDPPGTVLEHHSVVVHAGRVLCVLPTDEARRLYVATETVERAQHALLPGFVNAHTHAAMSLLRSATGGQKLDAWLRGTIWPVEARLVDEEFIRTGASLAIAEMLLSGITCFGDMYYLPEVTARAAAASGMRARVGLPVVEGETPWGSGIDEHLARGLALHDEMLDDPLVATLFALHSPSLTQDATLARVRTLADQLQIPVMIHLLESPAERSRQQRRHGVGPLERLERAGLVNDLLVAVHCVQASAAEIDRLARAGAAVVHCPASNLKLGNGIAPLPQMLLAGLTIGLGTDGAASNDALDVLGECRLAALLAAGVSGEPALLPPHRALELATLGGARALGIAEQTGSVAVGKWADLTCIDLSGPCVEPTHDVAAAIVHAGGRARVTDTWVAGRRLVADGRLIHMDVGALLAEVRSFAPRVAHCLAALEHA